MCQNGFGETEGWGTLLWKWWQGWWWSSLKTRNQRLNFDRRWVLFLFSKEERSRGLKINLLKTYRRWGWGLSSSDFSEYIHQTLPNESSGGGISQETRHSIVKIESMILGWESCDVTYGTVVISLVVVCIYIWRQLYLFEYWCHCSAPIPNLKYHENNIWISKVGLLITRLTFFIVAKTLRCISWYFIKRVREGEKEGTRWGFCKKKFVKLHERATFIASCRKN